MNSRQKGNAAELKIQKYLEARGWLVMKSPRTQKPIFIGGKRKYVSMANDFWGLYDIVAKKDNKTLWIQVKSTLPDASKVKKKILEFSKKYCNSEHESCEIWVNLKNKGYVIYFIEGDKWIRNNIPF